MKAVFLKDYGPFKKGQITELPSLTSAKLVFAQIIEPYIEKPSLITELKDIKPKRKKRNP